MEKQLFKGNELGIENCKIPSKWTIRMDADE
jgi:hypothetical protein